MIDPNGDSIYYKETLSNETNNYVLRSNNEGGYGFYNVKTNQLYEGSNTQGVDQLISAIIELKKEGERSYANVGNELVSYFETRNDRPVYIKLGETNSAQGNTITWDGKEAYISVIGSNGITEEKNPPYINLGHELGHVVDEYNKTFAHIKDNDFTAIRGSDNRYYPVPTKRLEQERSAMNIENMIRVSRGLSIRYSHEITREKKPLTIISAQ